MILSGKVAKSDRDTRWSELSLDSVCPGTLYQRTLSLNGDRSEPLALEPRVEL